MIHQSSESIKPHNELMAKIGIFWIYKNKIIGKTRALDEGEENISGILDSPDSHIDLWEQDPNFIIPFPELQGSEYQEVPRGRVVFSKKLHRAIVYMDKVLHSEEIREIISDFFQLKEIGITWKIDSHYTTDSGEIEDLWEET